MLPLKIYVVTFLLFVVTQSFGFGSVLDKKSDENSSAKTFVKSMQFAYTEGMDSVKPYSGSPCAEEITALSTAIRDEEMWALKMLDSSSKIQSGILQGNIKDLGMYSECVGVDKEYHNVTVRGKHCMVGLDFDDFELTSSICIPSSCNETQASQIVSFVMNKLLLNSSLESKIKTTTTTCAKVGSEDFTTGEILTIAFFSAVGTFVVACTVCDYLKRSWPERTTVVPVNTLAKFSLYTNALSILNMEVKPGTMSAVNGIRFLSTCWIVALHRYSGLQLQPFINSSEYRQWLNSMSCVWTKMGTFATDNFFFVSGFLMTYLFLKSMRAGNKFNLLKFYIRRYVRLTPNVAVMTLFAAVLFHRLGKGPLWTGILPQFTDACERNWWFNLLYVQNILPEIDICLLQTWFLAADMQLFLLSPLILYPLHRWPKYGLGMLSLFLIASLVTPPVIVGLNGYSFIEQSFPDPSGRFENYHSPPYTRAFPYLLGILLSYQVTTVKRHLSRVTVVFNWIASCLLVLFCFITMNYLIEYGNSPMFQTFCAALLRPCWIIAISWVTYACIKGHGGLLSRFLSLPIFLPLSRLSYGVYLVHGPIMFLICGTATTPSLFSIYEIFYSYLSTLVASITVSFVISLFFEVPVMVLEKIIEKSGNERENTTAMKNIEPVVDEGIQSCSEARSEA